MILNFFFFKVLFISLGMKLLNEEKIIECICMKAVDESMSVYGRRRNPSHQMIEAKVPEDVMVSLNEFSEVKSCSLSQMCFCIHLGLL